MQRPITPHTSGKKITLSSELIDIIDPFAMILADCEFTVSGDNRNVPLQDQSLDTSICLWPSTAPQG